MWIRRLDVRGFRRLSGTFELGAGLTVVVGDNEAGKSTLHDALVRSLYGFTKSDRRKADGVSAKDRCRPWAGGAFGLVARVAEAGALTDAYAVDWDFEAYTVVVNDLAAGAPMRDVAAERLLPGERLLALSLEDFRQVCCLDQATLLPVQRTDTLRAALEKAVSSGQGDVGVKGADDLLRAALGSLGANAGNLNPLAGGAWGEARAHEAELAAALAHAREQRAALAGMAAEVATAERERAAQLAAVAAAEQAVLAAELRDLEGRRGEVERLQAAAAARPAEPRLLPPAGVEAVQGARGALAEAELNVTGLEREAAALEPQLAGLRQRETAAERAVAEVAAAAHVDPSAEPDARRLLAALDQAAADMSEPAPSQPSRDPALARYRDERAALARLAEPGRRPSLIAVVLTFGIALVLHNRREARRLAGLAAALAAHGADSLAALDARVDAEEQAQAAAVALAEARAVRVAAARERAEGAAGELAALLDAVGAGQGSDPGVRARSYLESCVQRAEHDRRDLALQRFRAEAATVREPLFELDRRRSERDRLAGRLAAELAALGVAGATTAEALQAFDAAVATAKADERALADAAAAEQALAAALAGEEPAAFLARVEAARAALAADVARNGRLVPGDPGAVERCRDTAATVRAAAAAAGVQAAGLAAQLAQAEGDVAAPAELEERLAAATARVQRIAAQVRAVKIARDELQAAALEAFRDFAPRLNARLAETLPLVTGGRYREAVVDETLDVRLVAPETGSLVHVDELSRGTRDQVFLVQRLEIARLLDTTAGAAPLLLDDPFARFDARRTRTGLALLAEIAAARQVVVFTDDPAVAELALAVAPAAAVLELAAPPAAAALGGSSGTGGSGALPA